MDTPSGPPHTVAATSTLAMVREAEARGVRTADLLAAAGLTRQAIEDPDQRIPGASVVSIWGALRERTGDPALQLAAPTALPFGAYRVIDYLVGASATVGEGIRRFAGFFGLIADGAVLSIEAGQEEYCAALSTTGGGPIAPVYVDYVFAALVGRIRLRIRPGLRVDRVELRQAEPPLAARYREVFQAPVRFGAGGDRLWFTAQEWEAPMDSADEALAGLLEEHARILARRIPRATSGFVAKVQETMAASPAGCGSATQVARRLHVSVRTLQRRLASAGTGFREVSELVSRQLAEEYLADPRVSIAELTYFLGFSEPSSFTRAFRRWTGETPGQWRRRRQGDR
jgi:AraC-like DNA-binding protein